MSSSLVQHHPRRFQDNQYVYPVFSRRSGGLSIGVNLSPTARCNFACVYCQVLGDADCQIQSPPTSRTGTISEGDRKMDADRLSPQIDLDQLEAELCNVIGMVKDGSLFENSWLSQTPKENRSIKDIAFSGDGEPTLSPQFPEAVNRVVSIRRQQCEDAKIVLITNGTNLQSEAVRHALQNMLDNHGEIWAKLDAGSPEYFRTISRSTLSYKRILENLTEAARLFPLVIQSCFLSFYGVVPDETEIAAYTDRIRQMLFAGARIRRIQIYTVARSTPDPGIKALDNDQLDKIVSAVQRATNLPVEAFY